MPEEIKAEAKNIADLFFNMQDETDYLLVLNAISSADPEAQDLALGVIKSTLDSWNPQEEELTLL